MEGRPEKEKHVRLKSQESKKSCEQGDGSGEDSDESIVAIKANLKAREVKLQDLSEEQIVRLKPKQILSINPDFIPRSQLTEEQKEDLM